MLKQARAYIIICLLILFQYGNTFEHDYAWDDAIVITQNDRVQQGLSNPSAYFKNIKSDQIQHRYGYRPITLLSFGLDVELAGMTPKRGHVMNVLYYTLLCCLIFFFLRRMFPEKGVLFATIIVGLFIIHPVHTEVVANIKSRDEILAMIFGICSMIFFLQFLEKERRTVVFGMLTILALIASFLSKENGFTFVGIVILLAFYKSSEKINKVVKFGLPLVGGLLLVAIRMYVYSEGVFDDRTLEMTEAGQFAEDGFLGNPLSAANGYVEILPNVFNILLKDLGLLFFPITLVHDYGYAHSTLVTWTDPVVLVSVVLHLGLFYLVIREFKKKSALLFGILFYFITLSVYLHILQIGPDYMGERFLFIPSLGFLIAVVAMAERLTGGSFNADSEPVWKNGKGKIALGIFALLFVMGFVKTLDRNKAWENNTTLLEADIVALEDCARAQYNYAAQLHFEYKTHPRAEMQEKILYHYQRAVDISNRSMNAMLDLGKAYIEFGQADKGRKVYEDAARIHDGFVAPTIMLGQYYFTQEEYATALSTFSRAEEIAQIPDVYHWKAVCFQQMNQTDKALASLEEGEKYKPSSAGYYVLMADIYLAKEQLVKARKALEMAKEIAPNDPSIQKKLSEITRE